MPSERWLKIEALFHAAQALAPADRTEFLAEACSGDEALRQELESLLAQPALVSSFFANTADSPTSAVISSTLIGRRVGPYQVVSLLGSGGMGQVYLARDTKLGRDVAVKVLPVPFASDPERVRRFGREARALAALNHRHIAAIYGVVEESDVNA